MSLAFPDELYQFGPDLLEGHHQSDPPAARSPGARDPALTQKIICAAVPSSLSTIDADCETDCRRTEIYFSISDCLHMESKALQIGR